MRYKINVHLLDRVFEFLNFVDLKTAYHVFPEKRHKIISLMLNYKFPHDSVEEEFVQIRNDLFGNSIKISKGLIYYFFDHRWSQTSLEKIYKQFYEKFVKEYSFLGSQFIESQKDRIKSTVIKSTANINRWCDKKFKLDDRQHLIGFANGVYDLNANEFRSDHPEDCISLSTRNDYIEFSPNQPTILEVKAYLKQVFPQKSVEQILKDFRKLVLGSGKLHVWNGIGANSKSTLMTLFKHAFGDYAIELNAQLLGKWNCDHELYSLYYRMNICLGKRFIFFREPGVLNLSKIYYFIDGKFQDADSSTSGSIILESNREYLQVVDNEKTLNLSEALGDRYELTKFTNTFVNNPNPDDPHQLKRENMSKTINAWKQAFIYLILNATE